MLTQSAIDDFKAKLLEKYQSLYPEGIDQLSSQREAQVNRLIAVAMLPVKLSFNVTEEELRELWLAARVFFRDENIEADHLAQKPLKLEGYPNTGALNMTWAQFKTAFGPYFNVA